MNKITLFGLNGVKVSTIDTLHLSVEAVLNRIAASPELQGVDDSLIIQELSEAASVLFDETRLRLYLERRRQTPD